MGSLMAGWNSPVLMDPDTVKLERNKSLTKEEIEMFKKLQGKFIEEDGRHNVEPLSPSFFSKDSPKEEGSKKSNLWRSESGSLSAPTTPVDIKFGDWWTRSNWAFLNEPPLDKMDVPAQKYIAQFDVGQIATK